MILYEFEGKELLAKYGISVPKSQIVSSLKEKIRVKPPFIVKAQILSGKRKDAGGIGANVAGVLGKVVNKEKVEKVLVEEKVDHDAEYYFSITYDTDFRAPIITFSSSGGTGVEEKKVEIIEIDPISYSFKLAKDTAVLEKVAKIIPQLIEMFFSLDLLLLEINPLVIDKKG